MVLTFKQKGILSMIGAIFFHMGIGVIFILEDPYQLFYGYFIMPLMVISFACFGPIGGIIDYKFGCHLTMIISSSGLMIAIAFLYFSQSIWLTYLGMILLGFGGVGLMTVNKNVCFFFPQNRATMLSVMGSIGSLGMGFINFFGESLINPNNQQLKQGEMYYDYPVSQNILKFYIMMALSVIIGTVISLLFVFKFDQKIQVNEGESLVKESVTISSNSDNKSGDSTSSNSTTSGKENNPKRKEDSNSKYSSDLKKAFKSNRIWHLCILYFLTTFLFFLIFGTSKVVGTLQKFDVVVLKVAGVISGLEMSFSKPIWGMLFDRFGFKPLIIFFNICGFCLGILMCIGLHHQILFAFLMCISTTVIAGYTSIVGPHVMKIFSLKYSTEIGGVIMISTAFSNVLASIFAFCVSNFVSNIKIAFYSAYIIGALLNAISLVLVKYETDQPFIYDDGSMIELTEANEDIAKDAKNVIAEKLD